jgi:hypothetical protein
VTTTRCQPTIVPRPSAIAWLLTLPVTMILSGGLMALIRWGLSVA